VHFFPAVAVTPACRPSTRIRHFGHGVQAGGHAVRCDIGHCSIVHCTLQSLPEPTLLFVARCAVGYSMYNNRERPKRSGRTKSSLDYHHLRITDALREIIDFEPGES